MTVSSHIFLACLLAGGSALAAVPTRVSSSSALYLTTHSPFTSPAKEVPVTPVPLLADWALAGVAEVRDGYLISLNHRQKSGERMTLRSSAAGSYKVERVEFGKDWRETVVHVSSAGRSTALRFDPTAMVPAAKPAAPAPSNSPKAPATAASTAPKAPAPHPH